MLHCCSLVLLDAPWCSLVLPSAPWCSMVLHSAHKPLTNRLQTAYKLHSIRLHTACTPLTHDLHTTFKPPSSRLETAYKLLTNRLRTARLILTWQHSAPNSNHFKLIVIVTPFSRHVEPITRKDTQETTHSDWPRSRTKQRPRYASRWAS